MTAAVTGRATVHVSHPERLVAVAWEEIVDLAPDAAYRAAPAHDAEVDWLAVAAAMRLIVACLAIPPAIRRTRDLDVTLPQALADRERLIVESWFTPGPAPSLDAVAGVLDGKAQWPFELWAVNRGAPLPLELVALREVDQASHHSPQFRDRATEQATLTLERLPATVCARSPLASAALRRAADATDRVTQRPVGDCG